MQLRAFLRQGLPPKYTLSIEAFSKAAQRLTKVRGGSKLN